MSINLKNISKGKIACAPRIVIWGFDGVGKTAFAAGAPDPFFLDANKGSHEHDVRRLAIDTWDDAKECIGLVESGAIKCKTFVLDDLSTLEAMSKASLFQGTTMAKWEGGYGKGQDFLVSEWRALIGMLERIWKQGIGIIIVAHATVKHFDDPTGPGFDRFEIAATQNLAGMVRQWVDHVLFCREEVVTAGDKNSPKRATTTGVRWLYTQRKPAYDAKSRGSTLLPDRLPLSWKEFDTALKNDAARTADLSVGIDGMLAEINDETYAGTVRAYLKEYPNGIVEAHNRVAAKLEELRNKKQGE
jgi:hypothetical protein